MRYFALRIIKWAFYLMALSVLASGVAACIQIANGNMPVTFIGGKPPLPGSSMVGPTTEVPVGWAVILVAVGTAIFTLLLTAVAQLIGLFINMADDMNRTAHALERGGPR